VKSYSERQVFPGWARYDLHIATGVVAALDDHERPDWIRCHELARIVRPFLRARWLVVDGKFGAADHSWLALESYVLDVYSVARAPMVQLIDRYFAVELPWHPGSSAREDIREDVIRTLNYQASVAGFPHLQPPGSQ
jgi:hypothetical protein